MTHSLIRGSAVGDGTLGAAVSAVGMINDSDEGWVRPCSGRLRNRVRKSEDGEEESGDIGKHFGRIDRCMGDRVWNRLLSGLKEEMIVTDDLS